MRTESIPSDSTRVTEMPTYTERAKKYLAEWPSCVVRLVKEPKEAISRISNTEDWERSLTYIGAAAITAGLLSALMTFRYSPTYALRGLFTTAILFTIAPIVASAVFNFIFSIVKKDPGYHRTLTFMSVVSCVSPAALLVGYVFPLASPLVAGLFFYFLYHYSRLAADFSKKQSLILIGVMVALPIIVSMTLIGGGLLLIRP